MSDQDLAAPRPRTRILIIANALAWCAYFGVYAFRANPLGVFLIGIALMVVLAITTMAQLLLHFLLRKSRIHKALRTILFFMPSVLLVGAVLLRPAAPIHLNQRQNLLSPSGTYVLSIPIEKNTTNPRYKGTRVWKVTIRNSDGDIEYKDDDSIFVGFFNAYWVWDEDERVWFYNTDDGEIYFWEKMGGSWQKYRWSSGRSAEYGESIEPPTNLFPEYYESNHGLESTGAPPAAKAPETHP